jgi:hypothetical protein
MIGTTQGTALEIIAATHLAAFFSAAARLASRAATSATSSLVGPSRGLGAGLARMGGGGGSSTGSGRGRDCVRLKGCGTVVLRAAA